VRGRVLVAVSEGVALAAWRSGAREVQLQPLGPDGQPTGTASGVPVPGPSPQPIDLFVWGARAVLVTVDDTRADASVHATVLSHDGRPVAAPRPVPYDLLRPPPHVDLASRLGLPADAGTPAQPATRDDLDLILEREASGARLLRVLPSAGASAVGASTPLPDDVPVTAALAWQGRHWLLGNASTPAAAPSPRVYRVSCPP
jgi:hypothetical protein